MKKIVLAYSGGLWSSCAIAWLAKQHNAEIVTVTLDLGQGQEVEDVRDRALAIGAARAHVLDLRDAFAGSFVCPALAAGAFDRRCPSTLSALSRPLVAATLLRIAAIEEASTVAHAAPPFSDDEARIERAIRSLDPAIKVIAPGRAWGWSRADAVEYAKVRGIPIVAGPSAPSIDSTLWARAISGGALDDPAVEAADEVFQRTRSAADAPNEPAHVEIEFERGVPRSINGVAMSPVELIQSLETIAGGHGVGRLDGLDTNASGMQTRVVREAPAAVVLQAAHDELQALVTSHELQQEARLVASRYAAMIQEGWWHSSARDALDAFVVRAQADVTGTVNVRLNKGACDVVSRRAAPSSIPAAPVAGSGLPVAH